MPQVQNQFRVEPPDELGQVVRTDATGDVDVSLVECYLLLSPAQRLERVEQFANTILTIWKSRGIEWSASERF
jgi:hypothetical protein